MNNATGKVDIVSIADPAAMVEVGEIVVSTLPNFGGMNSVAAANGVLAVAVQHATKSEPGVVALYSIADGTLLKTVTVGALSDMLTFSNDGTKLLVANEAENPDDGELGSAGSISLIDLSGAAAAAARIATKLSALLECARRERSDRCILGRLQLLQPRRAWRLRA